MHQDPVESVRQLVGGADGRDSQVILDLIEQLDRDLVETNKNASRRE